MPASRSTRLFSAAGFVEPMQCLAIDALPEGPEWAYEFKLDGHRALGLNIGGSSWLISRNAKDLSARFRGITEALERLPDETVVDGEIVAIDAAGRPSFNDLQNYQTTGAAFLLPIRPADLSRRRSAPATAQRAASHA